jgi:uncharacterized short protein YbdD (DUF466 family)
VSVRAPLARALAALRRALRALHVVVGAPDYERYLAHHRLHHAGAPLGRADFERRQMERRAEPGARCC